MKIRLPIARPAAGARVCLVSLLATAGLLGAALACADDPGAFGPLPWRVGGHIAFTVDACSFPDSNGTLLEVYVRVPPATLTSLATDDSGQARLRISARLKGSYGASQRSATQELAADPGDSTGGYGKVVLMRFKARPGPQHLWVKLEDLKSHKRGLLYLGRNIPISSEADGEFEIPGPQHGREVSDVEFLWSEAHAQPSDSFWRSGYRAIPNPERLYGLFAKQLKAFVLVHGLSQDVRPWHWVARMLDSRSRVVAQTEGHADSASWLSAAVDLDVSGQPAGGYDLEVKAWQEGDSGSVFRRSHFSVAWERNSWVRSPRDVQDIVHFLLSGHQEDDFARLSAGEQERYLEDFWKERDPTPDTPENEARSEFLHRVAVANENYSLGGMGPGMFSDMGRVYIRYGEPSEVLRQVVPAGDNTLLQVLQELSLTEDRPIGEVHQKGLGGDIRPFEVWIYEGDIPLPPDADPHLDHSIGRRRLVFLFVDEQGLGIYRLRYSTE